MKAQIAEFILEVETKKLTIMTIQKQYKDDIENA